MHRRAHPMAGIARRGEDAVAQIGEIGQSFHGDSKGSAPGIIYLNIRQMWENTGQWGADLGGDVPRKPIPITLATAKEQSTIRRQAEIIHHEIRIRHGDILGQHLRGTVPQRLGRDDEIVDGHHPRGHFAMKPTVIAIAGQDNMICDHTARVGLHNMRRALATGANVMHLRALMDLRASLLRRLGQPKGQFQRVQMRGPHIQQAAIIQRRGAKRLCRGAIQHLNLFISIAVLQMRGEVM